jgi:hypothetical protein
MESLATKNSMMRSIVAGLFMTVLSVAVYAEDRVIEDTLVYNDPTVAHQSQWVKGVSAEFWNVNTSMPSTYGTINVHANQPGVSGFVGYGDFSVLAGYRKGTGTADLNTTVLGNSLNIHDTISSSALEVDVRWLLRNIKIKFVTPYLLVGHVEDKSDATMSATLNGSNYALTNPSSTSTSKTNLAGVGGIFPINPKMGIRADVRYGFVNTSDTSAGTDSYKDALVTATFYYNILRGLNAQVGGRYDKSGTGSSGSAGGSVAGFYATFGYSFQ